MPATSILSLGATVTADSSITDWLGGAAQQQLVQQAAADTAAVSMTWTPRLARVIFDGARQPAAPPRKNLELIALLETWRQQPWSDEDERWPELEHSLDADRLSERRRFRD